MRFQVILVWVGGAGLVPPAQLAMLPQHSGTILGLFIPGASV